MKANAESSTTAHAGVGSVSHDRARCSTRSLGIKPIARPLSRHRPGAERSGRRPGRLYVRPDRQRGRRRSRAAPSRPMPSRRPSAPRRCPMCRPPRKPACRTSRLRPGTRFSRPRERRSRVVAKLNDALGQGARRRDVRKRLLDLGSVIPAAPERTPEALAALVKSEIAKWTPVIKPAAN